MKDEIRQLIKRLIGKPELMTVQPEYERVSPALKTFVAENDEFLLKKHHLEKRGGEDFLSSAIKEMRPDFNFFNSDVYTRNPDVKVVFEYDNFHSGTPMEYRPFPGAMRNVRKTLRRKNLYWYPRSAGGYYAQQAVVDYLIREGFQPKAAEISADERYEGIGVDNIVFTCSTTHAYTLILDTIARPGDVVIMTAPNYGLFALAAEAGGYRTELVNLKEKDGWLINPDDLAKKIDELNSELAVTGRRVAAFLNLNPHNPTGKVLNHKNLDILRRMGDVCRGRGVFVIDDLVYRDLTYDMNDLAVPLASMPEYFNNTISLFGLSKAYGLASFRAAAIVAPVAVAEVLTQRLHDTMDSMPVLQVAAVSGAFNGKNRRYREYRKYIRRQLDEYRFRYELMRGMIYGVNTVSDLKVRKKIVRTIDRYIKDEKDRKIARAACREIKLRAGTEPDSGFFVVFDFTGLKGKKTPGGVEIKTERDLLEYFYQNSGILYLMGGNICWPVAGEMVGRVSFGISRKAIIKNMLMIKKAERRLK